MPNLLSGEKSPYLLQHAHNPVDWRPWGGAAFEAAGAGDRPVLLSIGYSTCHWCHVMAHESFEDLTVAEVINRDFVPVKVDREERPDVDAVYMAACVAMNGSGGWPLTLLLTPDQRPFWAGTYLPKRQLLALLDRAAQLWREDRAGLLEAGETMTAYLRQEEGHRSATPGREVLEEAVSLFASSYDPNWGGFGSAPKFPTAHNLLFLLRYAQLAGDGRAREMAEGTLEGMYRGGLFDHVGGGFSRYSTDERWLVPHFEKTLYDNALLALALTEAYRQTGRPLYARLTRRTLDYVLSELTDDRGGFYCGQDADSEGVEGKFYVFAPGELEEALGEQAGKAFCKRFGITAEGNFEGKGIPNLMDAPDWEEPGSEELLAQVRRYRKGRTTLHRDDKVLTAWNGLMIAAMARAGLVLEEARYLESAARAADFLREALTDGDGRLLARWREGEAAHPGKLDDYAFYAWGLLELYAAAFRVNHLAEACALAEHLLELFFDRDRGGFYPYASDGEQLLTRSKEVYDGAMPSGNAVAALVLSRLARLTGEARWRSAADLQLGYLAGAVRDAPVGHSFALLAMLEELWPTAELICAAGELPGEWLDFLREEGGGNLTALLKTPQCGAKLAALAPFTGDYPCPEQGARYYLCRNRACAQPVETIGALKELLK